MTAEPPSFPNTNSSRRIDETNRIVYKVDGEDAIGYLMHDFRESSADKMHYAEIAERVRFHKQEDGEVSTVCRAFEEYGREKAEEARKEARVETQKEERTAFATKLIKKNKLPLEDIADAADLPLEQVRRIAEQLKTE